MLPGQGWVFSNCNAGRDTCGASGVDAYFSRKCAASSCDIFGAIAQGWDLDGEAAETVVKIFAEFPLAYERQEVSVSGGDDASVDAYDFGAAQALQFLLFQKTQQLGLETQGHLANFVEEKRASLRRLDSSRIGLRGAGKRAAGISEEFGFEQGFGNGGTIDDRESARSARA